MPVNASQFRPLGCGPRSPRAGRSCCKKDGMPRRVSFRPLPEPTPNTLRELETWKVSVICMNGVTFDLSSPHGRMLATFLSGIAEFERDLISERVKSGLAVAKARGTKLGRQPGQRPKSDKLAPKVLALIAEGRSYRWIAIWRLARIRLLISSNAIARVANDVVTQISAIRRSVSKSCSGWEAEVRTPSAEVWFAPVAVRRLQSLRDSCSAASQCRIRKHRTSRESRDKVVAAEPVFRCSTYCRPQLSRTSWAC